MDRIIGPNWLFYYHNVFNHTQLWLFGENHNPYTKDTGCTGASNLTVMKIVDIFKTLIKDKNTYILIERSNLTHASHCLLCAEKQQYSTMKCDLVKFKVLSDLSYRDRIIFGDDIRHRQFYHLLRTTVIRKNKFLYDPSNVIIYIEYVKGHKTLKDLFEHVVKVVRQDQTYKEMYNKSPATLQKYVNDYIDLQLEYRINPEHSATYTTIRDYYLTLNLEEIKGGDEKLYESVMSLDNVLQTFIHIISSDMYTIMFIYNNLKGKRVICYNGGAHTRAMRRFLDRYYHKSPDKKYGEFEVDRREDVCLDTDGLKIKIKF